MRDAARPSLLSRLFRKPKVTEPTEAPKPEAEFVLADGEGLSTDLDKSWHGIHYLLTGTAWEGCKPLDFLVSGGQTVGDIDVGYGPARVLSPSETRAAHEALIAVPDADLHARFNSDGDGLPQVRKAPRRRR